MYCKKIGFFIGLGILATFSSCLNGSSSDATPSTPVSGLAFLHSAPGSPNLNVVMDGKTINTSAFVYAQYVGYGTVSTGAHSLRFTSSADQSVQLDTSVNLVVNKSYTVFLYNRGAKMKSIVSLDESVAFVSGTGMMVRVINLSPDLGEVKVVLTGETKSLADQVDYTELTSFSEYAAKASTVEVRSVADNHVIASANFDPVPHQFFTVAILGYVTPPANNFNKLTVKVINN